MRAAIVVALVTFAGCLTPRADEAARDDAAIAEQMERLEMAFRDGDDAAARAAQARLDELHAAGPERARADEAVRLLDTRVEPRLQPAFDVLRHALASGDDALARSTLARLKQLGPTGAAAELAAAFENVLRGRFAIDSLDLRAECAWTADPGATGTGTCAVRLAARSRDGIARELEPGPASLELSVVTVDPRGGLGHASETRSFDALTRLAVPAEGAARVELSRIPLELPPGALALRLTARVRLSPGSVREAERALPAQKVPIEHGELVLLAGRLLTQGPAGVDELRSRAGDASARPADLLDVALRVRREDRAAVLDGLTALADDPARIERLASSLRWLAPDVQGGADPLHWQQWLAERGRRIQAERRATEPVLPRAQPARFAEN